jgi:hypothetical protein
MKVFILALLMWLAAVTTSFACISADSLLEQAKSINAEVRTLSVEEDARMMAWLISMYGEPPPGVPDHLVLGLPNGVGIVLLGAGGAYCITVTLSPSDFSRMRAAVWGTPS